MTSSDFNPADEQRRARVLVSATVAGLVLASLLFSDERRLFDGGRDPLVQAFAAIVPPAPPPSRVTTGYLAYGGRPGFGVPGGVGPGGVGPGGVVPSAPGVPATPGTTTGAGDLTPLPPAGGLGGPTDFAALDNVPGGGFPGFGGGDTGGGGFGGGGGSGVAPPTDGSSGGTVTPPDTSSGGTTPGTPGQPQPDPTVPGTPGQPQPDPTTPGTPQPDPTTPGTPGTPQPDPNPPVTPPAQPTPVSPVPEPAAWVLLIGGVGAIGAALRRVRHGASARRAGTR